MLVSEVKKMPPEERFLYWIKERHQIHECRLSGMPRPWTDDKVLQSVFFTNPYREHDKTTVWFRENVREPLRDSSSVLMATVIFRWFNLIATGEILKRWGLFVHWSSRQALRLLDKERKEGRSVFTGAYMINSPGGEPKLEAILRRINGVWQDRRELVRKISGASLQDAHRHLTQYSGLGGFMAYEIVCDLRYTYLLEEATDKRTWCNPGPGCIRGLYRLDNRDFPKGHNSSSPPRPKNWLARMEGLLALAEERLVKGEGLPPMEMREIEHSLCETDKYERVLWGDGRPKRTYKGGRE